MDDYDPIFICEKCEEEYVRTADWDDECYCFDCALMEFPLYVEEIRSYNERS